MDSVNPQKVEGWCRLRICRVDVLSAFRKPLEPNVRENLARFALAAGLLPSASAPADKIPPPEAKNDGTLGNRELATANGVPRQQEEPKRPIPKVTLVEHMSSIKQQGGPEPAADKLWKKIRIEFPRFHVTRTDVRAVHKEVWGQLRPGKRS